jgi:hypothetical protein
LGSLLLVFNGAMNHPNQLLLRYFHYRLDLLCCKCKLNQKFCQTWVQLASQPVIF